ncbi:hypothetical protein F5I97DRAFT_1812645 [Phlebopus sp. FC_14]|nr:hypothetical protein F5I97DRAFT_1812645 [Phlebopus sp. FC_14]
MVPALIRRIVGRRKPLFVQYGPIGILATAFVVLLAISLKITHVYLDSSATTQVTREDAISSFGVSGSLANIFAIDVDAQTFSIHWSIIGACGRTYTNGLNDSCYQNQFIKNMALYLNENATSSNWNMTMPIGVFSADAIRDPPPVNYITGRGSIPPQEFDTVLAIDPFLPYTQQKKYSTLFYPFDQFTTFISLLAIDPDDNSTIPISGVVGYGNIVNWEASGSFYAIPVGQNTLYSLVLTAGRHRMIKAFVLVLVITNWILSLAVLWMTILVLFKANIDNGIILGSTTVLFALPQIRASMPDSPPFGTIFSNIGGYFMNVCLVSACTSVLLFSQLQYHYRPMITTSVELKPEERQAFLVDTE